jgi:hypothetical protein
MISAKRHPSTNHSTQLDDLRMRFEVWRQSCRPRARIPSRLWDAAVHVAGQYGLHRTAKTLHLDYYALKKRLDACSAVQTTVPFIELSPVVSGSAPECIIELEARDGAKMRIHLKSMGAPDLNAFSEAFWRSRR